jgi:hypothetical protein
VAAQLSVNAMKNKAIIPALPDERLTMTAVPVVKLHALTARFRDDLSRKRLIFSSNLSPIGRYF